MDRGMIRGVAVGENVVQTIAAIDTDRRTPAKCRVINFLDLAFHHIRIDIEGGEELCFPGCISEGPTVAAKEKYEKGGSKGGVGIGRGWGDGGHNVGWHLLVHWLGASPPSDKYSISPCTYRVNMFR